MHRWIRCLALIVRLPQYFGRTCSSRNIPGFRTSLGTLSKPRRRRQRGHGKRKDLIGRTIAQHVRFKTLYISWPPHAIRYAEVEVWRRMRR